MVAHGSNARRRAEPAIADLGLIPGDRTAAMVGPDGRIVWWCHPRIDSPSIFGALLDGNAGAWELDVEGATGIRQEYLDGTLLVRTTWLDHEAAVLLQVTDWHVEGTSVLAREVQARDRCNVTVRVAGRLDYARRTPAPILGDRRAVIAEDLVLAWDGPVVVTLDGPDVVLTGDLEAGHHVTCWLGGRTEVAQIGQQPPDPQRNRQAWATWTDRLSSVGTLTSDARHAAQVLRSLVHVPTGAVVAAVTTSLPERLGGVRNWDYRYCWLRDAAWILEALVAMGSHDEAVAYLRWFTELIQSDGTELAPLYRVDGSRDMTEQLLGHLHGYSGSRPVRVGNSAVHQSQLDVYAMAIDLQWQLASSGGQSDVLPWWIVMGLVKQVLDRWREPDSGLWEIRAKPRRHTFSAFQCWLAVDRASKLGNLRDEAVPASWAIGAAEILSAIMTEGIDPASGSLVQAFGESDVDAALLLAPLKGLVAPDSPTASATIERVRDELDVGGGLLHRYRSADGLPGREGAFLLCSFWLAELLARRGAVQEAEAIVDAILAHRGPLRLLAEELDPATGMQLGNTPQGFSHLGLIRAAVAIHEASQAT